MSTFNVDPELNTEIFEGVAPIEFNISTERICC